MEQLIQPNNKEVQVNSEDEELTDEDFGFFGDIDIEETNQSEVKVEEDELTDEDFGFFDDIDEDEQI